jgi:hypothetical protein
LEVPRGADAFVNKPRNIEEHRKNKNTGLKRRGSNGPHSLVARLTEAYNPVRADRRGKAGVS